MVVQGREDLDEVERHVQQRRALESSREDDDVLDTCAGTDAEVAVVSSSGELHGDDAWSVCRGHGGEDSEETRCDGCLGTYVVRKGLKSPRFN